MAVTTYATNNPLAVKLWSKRLSVEALKATWAYRFIGDGADAMIQVKDETQKSAGDQITPYNSVTAGTAGASTTVATVKTAEFICFTNGKWKVLLSS